MVARAGAAKCVVFCWWGGVTGFTRSQNADHEISAKPPPSSRLYLPLLCKFGYVSFLNLGWEMVAEVDFCERHSCREPTVKHSPVSSPALCIL